MSLLTWLGLKTDAATAYDPLADANDVSNFALTSFHSTIADLKYANEAYDKVKAHAREIILAHEARMKTAHTGQEQNNKVIAKISEFLGLDAEEGPEHEDH